MSAYYNINGLKVRVSDHEPNFAMDRMRGHNDVEFYTVDACKNKLSVFDQIEGYCDKHDLDISLFSEIIKDYPDEVYEVVERKHVNVTMEFIEKYRAIHGKGSTKKQERLCEAYGVDYCYVSQGLYKIVD